MGSIIRDPQSLPNFEIFPVLRVLVRGSLNITMKLLPVQTIFPDEKINAVVRGSLILIITAANRFGLYSAFLACIAIFFKSSFPQSKSTVATIFCSWGESTPKSFALLGFFEFYYSFEVSF